MICSEHAVKRWKQRTGCKYADEKIKEKLISMVENGREVFLQEKYRALALMCHRYRPARYFYYNGYIIVVADEVVVTLHNGNAKRWII